MYPFQLSQFSYSPWGSFAHLRSGILIQSNYHPFGCQSYQVGMYLVLVLTNWLLTQYTHLQKSLTNLLEFLGLKRVAQELLYFEIGYLPTGLTAGNDSQVPGPGISLLVNTMKLVLGRCLIVYLMSLSVEPKSYVPGATQHTIYTWSFQIQVPQNASAGHLLSAHTKFVAF